jgi:tetratricopeptide (TPR) repeat protein
VERADAVLDEARALDPRSEAVALAASRIAERRGDHETALREAVRASDLAPSSSEAWRRVAALVTGTARAPELLSRLGDEPLALRARLALAIARSDAADAEAILEALLRTAPVHQEELAAVIELALAEGKPALAVHLAERLSERVESASLLARALLAAGRPVEAEGLLATQPPEAFGGPRAAAELWLLAGRPERAAELAEAAEALGDPRAHLVQARARLALGAPIHAAELAARVPAGATDAEAARVLLRAALAESGLGALAEELAAFEDGAPEVRETREVREVRETREDSAPEVRETSR